MVFRVSKFWIIMVSLLLICTEVAIAGQRVAIDNEKLRIEFERQDRTWLINSFLDKTDGFDFLSADGVQSPLWELELVRQGAKPETVFRGGSAGEPIDFRFQQGDLVTIDALTSSGQASYQFIGTDRRRLQLVWDRIKLPDQSVVKVTVDVDLSQPDQLSRWNIKVDCQSKEYGLWKIRFVQLTGLTRARDSKREYYILPAGSGLRYPLMTESAGEWVYPSSTIQLQMTAYLVEEANKGLLYACYDPQANTKKLHLSNRSGSVSLFWEHYPENMGSIRDSYQVPYPVVVGAFTGDWFEASQIYKAWGTQQPWCGRGRVASNDIPEWFKENNLWKRPDGDPSETSKNMQAFADWFGGPFCVQWYTWNSRTYDSLYPDFLPARPGFAEAVSEMEKRGIRIFPYINGLLCDPNSETWSQGAEQWVAKTVEGKLYPYPVESNFWAYHMCPATGFWQQRIRQLCLDMDAAAETSGMYFDCLGGMDSKLCFDTSHGHPLGGGHYWHNGFKTMMKQIRDDYRSKKRDVALTTELMCESMIDSFDGVLWTTIDSPIQIPLFQAIYGEYILSFGRGERWEDWEQDGCFENREAEAFNWGYQLGWQVGTRGGSGNFELEPKYIERSGFFKELTAARAAAADFIVRGAMMKPLALRDVPTVSLDGSYKVFGGQAAIKPVMYSSVWRNDQGIIAVCFVNSSREVVNTSFAFDPAIYGLNGSKPVGVAARYPRGAKTADSVFDLAGGTSRVSVPPRSALIIELSQ